MCYLDGVSLPSAGGREGLCQSDRVEDVTQLLHDDVGALEAGGRRQQLRQKGSLVPGVQWCQGFSGARGLVVPGVQWCPAVRQELERPLPGRVPVLLEGGGSLLLAA